MEKKKLSNLTDHQRALLEMLKDFDAVCQRHGIKYQLFAGTALGTVRHHGFIPWDDDVDVILLRSEYERFFEEAAKDFDAEKYYVQQENTPHWPMQFSKLRLNGTTCIEKYHPRDKKIHQGVYIDIFPLDNLADNKLTRKLQFAASKIVIAKALYERGYETHNLFKRAFMQLCRMLPQKSVAKFCMRKDDSKSQMVHSFFAAGKKYEKNIFPREWFEETTEMQFEDENFPVSMHYDAILSRLYGDYHKIPTPEERKSKEHAAILDLERPYTEYLEEQKKMKFDAFTKSIR